MNTIHSTNTRRALLQTAAALLAGTVAEQPATATASGPAALVREVYERFGAQYFEILNEPSTNDAIARDRQTRREIVAALQPLTDQLQQLGREALSGVPDEDESEFRVLLSLVMVESLIRALPVAGHYYD